ncbi:MAG: hypothetical protein EA406_08770 [Rhodospirillales bacterium]|nr:MAG: hypothetical protein EA406_08770 [Rhodospirillales bacterium]
MAELTRVLGALLSRTLAAKEQADRHAGELAQTYLDTDTLARMGPPSVHGLEVVFELKFALGVADRAGADLERRLEATAQDVADAAVQAVQRELEKGVSVLARWGRAYRAAQRDLRDAAVARELESAVADSLRPPVHAAAESGALDLDAATSRTLSAIDAVLFNRGPVRSFAAAHKITFDKARAAIENMVRDSLNRLQPAVTAAAESGRDGDLAVIVDSAALAELPERVVSSARLQFVVEEGEAAAFSATIDDPDDG